MPSTIPRTQHKFHREDQPTPLCNPSPSGSSQPMAHVQAERTPPWRSRMVSSMGPLYGTFPRAGVKSGHLKGWKQVEAKPFWSHPCSRSTTKHKNAWEATQKWGNILKHQSILKDKFKGHVRAKSMKNMVTHPWVHKTLDLVNCKNPSNNIQKHFISTPPFEEHQH